MLVFPRVTWPHSLFLQQYMFAPVDELIYAHDLKCHLNANDVQTFISGPVLSPELWNCLKHICLAVPQKFQSQHA